MNERIFDMAREKGATAPRGGRAEGVFCFTKDELKEFAELLVRECSQFVEDKFDFCGDEIIIAEGIREHFEIEE